MSAPPRPIRVLLLDPHPVVRTGLRMLLDSRSGLTVVGEANGPTEALAVAAREQVDILLVDLNLTKDSLEFLQALTSAYHSAQGHCPHRRPR
jgi:two-component system response regulator DevR